MCREEFELIKHSLNNVENIKDVMDNPVISFFESAILPLLPAGEPFKSFISGIMEATIADKREKLLDVICSGPLCVTTEMVNDVEIIMNFIKTVEAVDRLATNDKIVYFGNLLRNGYFCADRIQADKYEEYFNAISSLSYRQLSLLALLYLHSKKQVAVSNANDAELTIWNSFKKEACECFNLSEGELVSILKATEKTGLCKEVVGAIFGYRGGRFEATPILNDFAAFVFAEGASNS